MKPIITWIVLANTREARVFENSGPGKGPILRPEGLWHSQEATPHRRKPGVGHSIGGPGMPTVDEGDPQQHIDQQFARVVTRQLGKCIDAKKFERLIVVAGPDMLGLMRAIAGEPLIWAAIKEIAKDLTAQPMDVLARHIGNVIAA